MQSITRKDASCNECSGAGPLRSVYNPAAHHIHLSDSVTVSPSPLFITFVLLKHVQVHSPFTSLLIQTQTLSNFYPYSFFILPLPFMILVQFAFLLISITHVIKPPCPKYHKHFPLMRIPGLGSKCLIELIPGYNTSV